MREKIATGLGTMLLAFLILSATMLSTSSIRYAYTPVVLSEKVESEKAKKIDYEFAYPGKIHPDSPFWYAKVIRDKAWLAISLKPQKKAELNLLFADKRLMSSLKLFESNKPDLGLSTLTKAEKYLELAEKLSDNSEDGFYEKLATSSLKHRELIEQEIMPIAPEDLRPHIVLTLDKTKEVYKKTRDRMLTKGLVPPENIFD